MSKCHFGFKKVSYLGFVLSENGIQPGEQKVIAIQQIEQPQNRHNVRRFLGLTSFFRQFILHYARLAAPISDLLKNGVLFVWGQKQKESFKLL